MKPNIRDFPPTVDEGGYVYALAFSNGFVKVGKSTNPSSRIAVVLYNVRNFNVDIVDWWISAAHLNYEETERALIAIAGSLTRDPDAFDSRTEYFEGVDFDTLVELCNELQLNEVEGHQLHLPAHLPAAQVASFEDVSLPAYKTANVGRAARRTLQRHPEPKPRTGRGSAFADLVVGARYRLGLTQDAVISRSGVSKSTLIRWEGGKAERPEPDQVRSLCLALGVRPVDAAVALGFLTADDIHDRASA